MATDTREQFLNTAETLFAERGFYGVSIASIANELGLTKQALLHHFGSKEKLYGAVLARISERLLDLIAALDVPSIDPKQELKDVFLKLLLGDTEHAGQTRLLMRELLDNKRRADSVGTWYLKPLFERLISMLRAVPAWQSASDAEALALLYQILGAITYFRISAPTLTGIFGTQTYTELEQIFPRQLEQTIEAAISGRIEYSVE